MGSKHAWQVCFSSDHVLMTLSALLALCEGNPLATGGFLSSRISYLGLWYFCYQSDKHHCLTNIWVAGKISTPWRKLSFFMDWKLSFDITKAKTMILFSKCHICKQHNRMGIWCIEFQINWSHLRVICDDFNEKIQLSLSNKVYNKFCAHKNILLELECARIAWIMKCIRCGTQSI